MLTKSSLKLVKVAAVAFLLPLVLSSTSNASPITYDLFYGPISYTRADGAPYPLEYPVLGDDAVKAGEMVIERNPAVYYPDGSMVMITDVISYNVTTPEFSFNGSGRFILLGADEGFGPQIFDFNEGGFSGSLVSPSYSGFVSGAGTSPHFYFYEDGSQFPGTFDAYAGSIPSMILNSYDYISAENGAVSYNLPSLAVLATDPAPAPEPSTILLLSAGLACLGFARRRAKK